MKDLTPDSQLRRQQLFNEIARCKASISRREENIIATGSAEYTAAQARELARLTDELYKLEEELAQMPIPKYPGY